MKWSLYTCVLVTVRFFFRILYHNKVYGLEHQIAGGAIIAPNHCSFLDPPLVAISSREEIHFLARSTLFRIPLLGFLIRHLNAHPVRRDESDTSAIKLILNLLKSGEKVLLFPEGRRSPTTDLQPLQKGIAFLLLQAHTPIIPVYAHGTFAIWNRKRRFPRLRGRTACVFGSPIFWEEFAHLEKREAHEMIVRRLHNAILDLKRWYDAGAKGSPP